MVRMRWFAFSEFLWTFRDPTKTNTVNTLILYTSRVKVVQVSNFSTRTTLPHACFVHIHQGQRRRRRGQRQGVRSGHAGGGEAAIEERETGSLEAEIPRFLVTDLWPVRRSCLFLTCKLIHDSWALKASWG